MNTRNFDLIVLGGGNAISTAIDCAAAGLSVALVEKGPLGGTCPHRGCIPSKLLIGYADVAQHVREAKRFGFETTLRLPDPDAILRDTFDFTAKYDGILQNALPPNLALYRGHAVFAGDRLLEVNGERLRGERLVLATGSRPKRPTGFDELPYWTSDDFFRQRKLPRSITIVGGGYIACEIGHFLNGIGVDTRLIARGADLLEREDSEIRTIFQRVFAERVPVHFHSEITSARHDGTEFHLRITQADGSTTERTSEALLFCIGRVPNTNQIQIENSGLTPNAHGFVEVDDALRTGVPGVYAMGDVAGRFMFTHAANFESEWLAQQFIEDRTDAIDYGPMPHAVFSSPEVAGVGPTEDELKQEGVDYVVATNAYLNTSKGRAVKEENGLCKILVARDGTILGCHIVGYQASVLLHEVIPVMRWHNHISAVADLIHIHPSLSEVVRGAARKAAALLKKDQPVARPVRARAA